MLPLRQIIIKICRHRIKQFTLFVEEQARRSFFCSTCSATGGDEEGTLSGRCHAPREEDEHPCFVDDGTPGDCTREEKCALRSCLMSIHALAWMSIAAPSSATRLTPFLQAAKAIPI